MSICCSYTQMTLIFKTVVHQEILSLILSKLRDKSNCSLVVDWFAILLDKIDSSYSILNKKL